MKIQVKLNETGGIVMLRCKECGSIFSNYSATMLEDRTLACPKCGSMTVEQFERTTPIEPLIDCTANAAISAMKDTAGGALSDTELKELTESIRTTMSIELEKVIKDRVHRMQLPKSEMSKNRYLEIYNTWKDAKKITSGDTFFYKHADVKLLINLMEELLAELHPKFMIDDDVAHMPSETFRSIWYLYLRLKHKMKPACTEEEMHLQVPYQRLFNLFEDTLLELSRYKEKGY